MVKLLIFLFLIASLPTFPSTILFLGDSLTEGYGIKKEDAFPSLVEKMIYAKLKKKVNIINGGVSGSTTNDGIARLKWYLKRKPNLLFLALGANDGLRGLKVDTSKANIQSIIDHAQKNKIKVLLAGMLMPPNYGQEYTEKFKNMYIELQESNRLKSMPFLLEGIAGKKEYNQRDGIHPNEEGHKIIARKVFTFIKDEI